MSPELFVTVNNGLVSTKPIKGTIARGINQEEDKNNIEELLSSHKDLAELSMIVDLLRNDLGRTSLPGTVTVENHAILESFENVHHLVSKITSEIEIGPDSTLNLILRAFPGGSISGVPKIRALEIIEQLESSPRELYTGNIGYLSINGNAEFNIAIRTAIKHKSSLIFNAGGGIVFDSDPVNEYIEMIQKAKHIAKYFGSNFVGHLMSKNGKFVETYDISFEDSGAFESILVKEGRIPYLQDHIARLNLGIEKLGLNIKAPSYREIIKFLKINIAENARLNIFMNDNGVHMKIQEYTPPVGPFVLLLDNIDFEFNKEVNEGYKPLKYTHYREKLNVAIERDCYDMILQNQNVILEGARTSIYFYSNKWVSPIDNVVHGIIRSKLTDQVAFKMVTIEAMLSSKSIAISNSLIGIKQVSSVVNFKGLEIWKNTDNIPLPKL